MEGVRTWHRECELYKKQSEIRHLFKFEPEYVFCMVLHNFPRRTTLAKAASRCLKTIFLKVVKVQMWDFLDSNLMKILDLHLKWVHMLPFGLRLRLERRIICKPLWENTHQKGYQYENWSPEQPIMWFMFIVLGSDLARNRQWEKLKRSSDARVKSFKDICWLQK